MSEIIIPKLISSVHMLPEGEALRTGVNRIFPEKGWHLETYQKSETKVPYFQKVQWDDVLTIQFDTTTQRPMRLTILGDNDFSVTFIGQNPVTIAGNTFLDMNGGLVQLYTHTAAFTFARIANVPPGIFWLRAEFEWDKDNDGVADYYQYVISEPIHLRERWENTALIDCRHDENDERFIWLGTGNPIVSFRVDGRLSEKGLLSEDESYKDSLMDASLLSSYPYQSWQLETEAIPAWLRLKLHHALSCKNTMVERRLLVKSGALELGEGTAQMRTVTATFLEAAAANNRAAEFVGEGVIGASVLVFAKPAGYPYLVNNASVTVDSSIISLLFFRRIVNNTADDADMVRGFNGQRLEIAGKWLYGQFVATQKGIYYFPHPFESRTVVPNATVLNKVFTIRTRERIGGVAVLIVQPKCVMFAIQWDSTQSPFTVYGSAGGSVSTWGISTQFPAASNPNALRTIQTRVFYRDDSGFSFQELGIYSSQTRGLLGILPDGLQKLTISYGGTGVPAFGVFDFNMLAGALATLTHVYFTAVGLTGVLNYGKPWAVLKYISFYGNGLDSTEVDGIINTTSANANAIYNTPINGLLELDSQNPPAPPTSASLNAYQDLVNNYNWTISND